MNVRRTTVALFVAFVAMCDVFAGAPANASRAQDDRPPVLVVAHRGASATAPEHTGPAYDLALAAGTDVLECDVQRTADDQLVCIHDATVDRTTGGAATGPVESFTLADLRTMDFGSWFGPEYAGARVVTLEEQLTCYRTIDPTMQFYVETKVQPGADDRMETLLVELLRRLDLVPDGPPDPRTSPIIVQSFDAESLATVRRLAPGLPTAFLVSVPTPELQTGQVPDVDVLAPNAAIVLGQPELVQQAHDAGLEVHTWTTDDPDQITALVNAGVDGFFTNAPDRGRDVVEQLGRDTGREAPARSDARSTPESVAGCPDGMGVGFTAAAAPDTGEGAATTIEAAAASEEDEGTSVWPIVAIIGGIVVVGAVVALLVRRRG